MKKLIVLAAAAAASALLIGCSTSNPGMGSTSTYPIFMQNGAAASRAGDIGSTIGPAPSPAPFTPPAATGEPVAPETGTK